MSDTRRPLSTSLPGGWSSVPSLSRVRPPETKASALMKADRLRTAVRATETAGGAEKRPPGVCWQPKLRKNPQCLPALSQIHKAGPNSGCALFRGNIT